MGHEEKPDRAERETPPNPFVSDDQIRYVLAQILIGSFKMSGLTATGNMPLTYQYAQLTALTTEIFFEDDTTQALYAFLFELGCFLHANSSDEGIQMRTDHDHDTLECSGSCQEQAAFADAAGRGDFDAVQNVIKAVYQSGERDPDDNGERALSRLYAALIVSFATSADTKFDKEPGEG